jgi:putative radical SAM enzyme (TIGR03279 family)
MVKIESVEPGSYAAELGLSAGDWLLSINDNDINDLVDYHRHIETGHFTLDVLHGDGELWEFSIEKESQEEFGLQVEHPQPRQCGNQCQFCFVHQLPKGMRRSLYVKDEDYRFSYLYGSYMTLTNLDENDLHRIIGDQLSPLYISVHATEHTLRRKLLGADIPEILPLIERLTTAGIELHCQIVLCPGLNDGDALCQTIEDLAKFYPKIISLAVVPVGLTKHRLRLPQLQKVGEKAALANLEVIHRYQDVFLRQKGSRFVFPADEFYLLAREPLPDFSHYEDFPQIENGVGLIVQFRQQIAEVLAEAEELELNRVTLVTGVSFQSELEQFAHKLAEVMAIELVVIAIDNHFFGTDVTVAGLVTGRDLLAQLGKLDLGDGVILPDVMLKDQGELFLDDVDIGELGEKLKCPVLAVETSPWGILDGLELLAGDGVEIIHV